MPRDSFLGRSKKMTMEQNPNASYATADPTLMADTGAAPYSPPSGDPTVPNQGDPSQDLNDPGRRYSAARAAMVSAPPVFDFSTPQGMTEATKQTQQILEVKRLRDALAESGALGGR